MQEKEKQFNPFIIPVILTTPESIIWGMKMGRLWHLIGKGGGSWKDILLYYPTTHILPNLIVTPFTHYLKQIGDVLTKKIDFKDKNIAEKMKEYKKKENIKMWVHTATNIALSTISSILMKKILDKRYKSSIETKQN
jgi:hypothetical protein